MDYAPELATIDRSLLREMIHEGLSSGRWAWSQAIAPTLRRALELRESRALTPELVKSVISEAEDTGLWPKGFAEAQLAEARMREQYLPGRKRHSSLNRARGEQTRHAKLTDAKVRSIRLSYQRTKLTIEALAKRYEVKPITISRVLRRATWAHVA